MSNLPDHVFQFAKTRGYKHGGPDVCPRPCSECKPGHHMSGMYSNSLDAMEDGDIDEDHPGAAEAGCEAWIGCKHCEAWIDYEAWDTWEDLVADEDAAELWRELDGLQ